jgi:hypothetical protein
LRYIDDIKNIISNKKIDYIRKNFEHEGLKELFYRAVLYGDFREIQDDFKAIIREVAKKSFSN